MENKIDKFNVIYCDKLIDHLKEIAENKNVLLVTMENLHSIYKDELKMFDNVVFIDNVDESYLDEKAKQNERYSQIVGFGGGMTIDSAKYIAWKNNKACYLIPSAVSVDACFSYPVAVRRQSKVVYVGEIFPKAIYINYDAISKAPPIINKAGVGDLLSIYTALFDWKIASEKGVIEMDSEIYDKANEYLNDVLNNPHEINNITKKGVKILFDGYEWVGITSQKVGHCRFEEGSEHFLAYCLESIDNKHYLHGQLVALGVYILSELQQEGRGECILEFLDKIELSIKPEDIGTTAEMLKKALKNLNDYCVQEKLAYSVINEKEITEEFIEKVIGVIQQ